MSIVNLWIPIVVAAALMWVASALIWAVLPWHKSDYRKVTDEEGVRAALSGAPAGCYNVPHCESQSQISEPETQRRFNEGPVAFITVLPSGVPAMGRSMLQMVLFFLFVGFLCAYFVSRTVPPEASYLATFRVAGCVAWIANGVAHIPESIWFGRPWSSTLKSLIDALIYGLLAGGAFGWLA